MKKIIDALEEEFGSLREAAKELKIPHQNLSYWRSHAKKQREFLEAFEAIRKALKIRKTQMWEMMLGEDGEK